MRFILCFLALLGLSSCFSRPTFEELTGTKETEILKWNVLPVEGKHSRRGSLDLTVNKPFVRADSDSSSTIYFYKVELILVTGRIVPCELAGVVLSCTYKGKSGSYYIPKELRESFDQAGYPLVSKWQRNNNKTPKFKKWFTKDEDN